MLIRSLTVEGLRGLGPLPAVELGRVVQVAGPPRALTALSDALALALGFFSGAEALRAFARWGAEPALPEPAPAGTGAAAPSRPWPEELLLGRPERVRPWLDPEGGRVVRVGLELELDPPQFGRVREAAARDPELSAALVEAGARVHLGLSWLFTQDLAVVAPSLLALRVGALELRPGDERVPLLLGLLRGLAGRGLVREPLALDEGLLAREERAPTPERRARAARMRRALAEPPFALGALEVVQPTEGPPWLAVGEALTPLRGLGPGALEAVGLCEAVWLSGAELLVLREPLAYAPDAAAWRAWLAEQAEGVGSSLEQVVLLGGPGEADLTLTDARPAPPPERTLRTPFLGR